MKRVILFVNGTDVNGKVFMITHSLDELLASASSKFNMSAKRIFTSQGGEIDDIKLIRDDDVLYVSDGQDFISKDKSITKNQLNRNSEWITLNIGGKYFTTTRDTLTKKEPTSMLARMFTETTNNKQRILPSRQDQNDAFLIDRSPTYFEPLLNYLRHGQIILDANVNAAGVLAEARFYGIEGAIEILTTMVDEEDQQKSGLVSLTRKDVLKAIMSTPVISELRFQGVDFVGADLSKLDLRNINFKYAIMRGCTLAGANLSGCCFDRADLSYANLHGAQLVCVKMLCANLFEANLHSCNFEDPAGSPANMEGANLKGANLEGSNMTAVNLRVATLKNAILRNCVLRAAILAGADLEDDVETEDNRINYLIHFIHRIFYFLRKNNFCICSFIYGICKIDFSSPKGIIEIRKSFELSVR
nr:BTB/POZ domain-containing protein KCTD9 isoform X2 [Megalopta genalis]